MKINTAEIFDGQNAVDGLPDQHIPGQWISGILHPGNGESILHHIQSLARETGPDIIFTGLPVQRLEAYAEIPLRIAGVANFTPDATYHNININRLLRGWLMINGLRGPCNDDRTIPVENIPVPASGSVELKPGSLHIMLMKLNKDLKTGDTFPLTLKYQKAGDMTVQVKVQPAN